jgi:hypothetical protein
MVSQVFSRDRDVRDRRATLNDMDFSVLPAGTSAPHPLPHLLPPWHEHGAFAEGLRG